MGLTTKHPLSMLALRLRRARYNSTLGGKFVRQADVARLLGVSHSTYWRWETGRQLPTSEYVGKIAKMFQLDTDDIWLDTGHLPPDMLIYLVTTREGAQTVKNIRRLMNELMERQKPTRRREVPADMKINDAYLRGIKRHEEGKLTKGRKKADETP